MAYPGDITITFEDYAQFSSALCGYYPGPAPRNPAHTQQQTFPIDPTVKRTGAASMRYTSWSKDEGGFDVDATSPNKLRIYQSANQEPSGPIVKDPPNQEIWWAWSLRFPQTGTYCWTCPPDFAPWHVSHPNYWGPMSFETTGGLTTLRMEHGGGRIVSPNEYNTGLYSDLGAIDQARLKANDPERRANGFQEFVPLLGDGGVRPFTKLVWHDFIMRARWNGYTDGILELKHREENGAWALLYSNVPGADALIQRPPHPTCVWNTQHGEQGEPGRQYDPSRTKVWCDYQMYRSADAPEAGTTWGIWCDNLLRRATEAEILAYLPGAPIPVWKASETAATITLGWNPVPGADGYRFTAEKQAKPSHTWDGSRTTVRFAKGSAWYRVEALDANLVGEYRP